MHVTDIRLLRNVTRFGRYAVYDMLYLCNSVAPAAYVDAVVVEVILCRNADLEALTAAELSRLNVKGIIIYITNVIEICAACRVRGLRNNTVTACAPVAYSGYGIIEANLLVKLQILKLILRSPRTENHTALKGVVRVNAVHFHFCRE